MTIRKNNKQNIPILTKHHVLNLTCEAGINLSATLTTVLNAELHRNAANKWQIENQDALEVLNHFHIEHGCFSDEYRTF